MLTVGDLTIYSEHGICRIDDICDKTYGGITKKYYVLHPIENSQQLTINIPVDNEKNNMMKLMDKEEAEVVINLFYSSSLDWIEKPQQRLKAFNEIMNSGDRKKIAKLANTLLRKKRELEKLERKFYENESKLLKTIEDILFKELAFALDTTIENIYQRINKIIDQSE